VLAATNENLEEKVKEGSFREDLFYRLNVIAINLPALRERKEDIPLLVGHFLRHRVDSRTGRGFQITRGAMDALSAHDWPGNVRELENALERACAMCENGLLRPIDLPPQVAAKAQAGDDDSPVTLPALPAENALASRPAADPGSAAPGSTPAQTFNRLGPLKDFVRHQEVAYINRILAQTQGDKEEAARVLGVSLATLYRKLAEEPAASSA
jgi:DNA-binding NtrC family response regulator